MNYQAKLGMLVLLLATALPMKTFAQDPPPYDGQPDDFNNPPPYDGEPDDFEPGLPLDQYLAPLALLGIAAAGYSLLRRKNAPGETSHNDQGIVP